MIGVSNISWWYSKTDLQEAFQLDGNQIEAVFRVIPGMPAAAVTGRATNVMRKLRGRLAGKTLGRAADALAAAMESAAVARNASSSRLSVPSSPSHIYVEPNSNSTAAERGAKIFPFDPAKPPSAPAAAEAKQ